MQGITGSGGQAPYDKARRPKPLKLLIRRALARIVVQKLRRFWSPEQIAGWLKCAYPNDESGQVSHETIYKSLFIQARGALKKELIHHLGSKRAIRRSRHASLKGEGLGKITNTVSISAACLSKRPAIREHANLRTPLSPTENNFFYETSDSAAQTWLFAVLVWVDRLTENLWP